MIADLIRAFVEAVVVREPVPQLPAGVRVEALHMYPKGCWAVEWSER
jgi:hypothetical protein